MTVLLRSQKHHSAPPALSNIWIIHDHAETLAVSSFSNPSFPLTFWGKALTLFQVDSPQKFWQESTDMMTLAFFFSSHSTFPAASSQFVSRERIWVRDPSLHSLVQQNKFICIQKSLANFGSCLNSLAQFIQISTGWSYSEIQSKTLNYR